MSSKDVKRSEIRFRYEGDVFDPRTLSRCIKSNVGSMCYISKMPENVDDFISVGVMRDEIVIDAETSRPRIHIRRIDNVFNGYYSDGDFGRVAVFPCLDDIHDRYDRSLNRIRQNAENCAIETFGSRILKIPTVRNQMNPLFEIVNMLLYSDTLLINDLDVGKWKKPEKRERYLSFLEGRGIIRTEGDHIVPGSVMEKEIERNATTDELYEMIVNRISEKDFFYLQEGLGVKNIRPFIRMGNVNCMTSIIEDRPLMWNWSGYQYYLDRVYADKPAKTTIVSNAVCLHDVGIFDRKKVSGESVFSCNDAIFDNYRTAYNRRVCHV